MADKAPEKYRQVTLDPSAQRTRVETVEKERLRSGVECVYARTDAWEHKGESHAIHVFRSLSKGREFGVWSAAQLDAKLKQVPVGATIYLRYDGKVRHPTDAKKTIHEWTVAVDDASVSPENVTDAASDADLPF